MTRPNPIFGKGARLHRPGTRGTGVAWPYQRPYDRKCIRPGASAYLLISGNVLNQNVFE
jgi:hypothetical protein